jgi:hypothetical protein
VPAHAAPGQPASAPRVRDPPATRLTTAARVCVRRMKTALSPLLFEVYCVLFVGFVGDCVTVGTNTHSSVPGELCLCQHMPPAAPLLGHPGGSVARPSDVTIVTPRSVPLSSSPIVRNPPAQVISYGLRTDDMSRSRPGLEHSAVGSAAVGPAAAGAAGASGRRPGLTGPSCRTP